MDMIVLGVMIAGVGVLSGVCIDKSRKIVRIW